MKIRAIILTLSIATSSVLLGGCLAIDTGNTLTPTFSDVDYKKVNVKGSLLTEDDGALYNCYLGSIYSGHKVQSTRNMNYNYTLQVYKGDVPEDLIFWCNKEKVYHEKFDFKNQTEVNIGLVRLPWTTTKINFSGQIISQSGQKINYCLVSTKISGEVSTFSSQYIENPSNFDYELEVSYQNQFINKDIDLDVTCNSPYIKPFETTITAENRVNVNLGTISIP
ncbi:hypothetical protein [Endozoicomonas sp.]|uniref:hypothetical protein n=1 Tax=Endozoicomonas sp. TaxID=1892382 RepID=UPI003AF86291